MITVHIRMKNASIADCYEDVVSTYEKGSFFCLIFTPKDGLQNVIRFPLANIDFVEEIHDDEDYDDDEDCEDEF